MRTLFLLMILLVFTAGFLLDTAGVAQMTYICATGGCGVRPFWLAVALGGWVGLWIAIGLARRISARRAAGRRVAQGRARGAGKRKPRPAAKNGRAGRRKVPVRT